MWLPFLVSTRLTRRPACRNERINHTPTTARVSIPHGVTPSALPRSCTILGAFPEKTSTHAEDVGSAAVRRDDAGLRRHAHLLRARLHAEIVRRDGGHADRAGHGPRREGRGLHGRRLRPRER